MTARFRPLAAGWLLTLTLTLMVPDPVPATRSGPVPRFSAPRARYESELRVPRGGGDRTAGHALDLVRWTGSRFGVRVSYEQSELLSRDQALG